MFSQFSDQVKISSQPVTDLFAANVKALQAVANQQTSLVSGVLNDSMKLVQIAGQQTEAKGLLAAQTVYAESVRERLTSTSKNTYSTLNEISQQFADTMRNSFATVGAQAATSIKTAPAKAVTSKKATVAKKAVVEKKAAPAKKAVKAKTAAPSTNSAKKASEKKVTEPKAVVASKVAAKPVTAKVAAKPVPEQIAKVERIAPKTAPKTVAKTNSNTTSETQTSKA